NGDGQRMKIVIAEKISPAALKIFRDEADFELVTAEQIQGDLISAVRDCDALVVRSAVNVNAAVIMAAQRLRVFGRAGGGGKNIEPDAPTRKGVVVINPPGPNATAVPK